ncbi:cyclin-G1-like isoform X3 [Acropora millepora]|uniref:cyclin-G1-like isoform X3 n=1 Tax=Acropora millepora TaxID=45264 RepID=UPI001CF45721|nr:cyclin-G1-like isoform X3 [Acropora millepora]
MVSTNHWLRSIKTHTFLRGTVPLKGFEVDVGSWEVNVTEAVSTAFCCDWEFNRVKMVVSCGLNVGKLLRVLHDGLQKEDTHVAPLVCLLGNEDSDAINLSTRDNTVAFMLDLSRHCSFHSETYSLSVNLLDRLLSVVKANPRYLPCMSISCLFLAVKMAEEDEDVPTVADFVKVSGLRFTPSDLLRMERIILDKLKWNLNATTPLYFLEVFHALCVSKGFLDHCPINQHLQHVTWVLEGLLCNQKFIFFKVQDSELLQCSKLVEEHLNAFVSVQKFPRLRLHLVPERQGVSLAVLNTKLS